MVVQFVSALWMITGFSRVPGQTGEKAVTAMPAGPAVAWVQAAAEREERVVRDDGHFPLAYRTRKIDDRGDATREVIESRDGAVARLVERDGRPLTRQQDADERDRLEDILSHPAEFIKHHRRNDASREYSIEMLRVFPRAMLLRYTPGQPQLGRGRAPQVVIDFAPDPQFKPPSLVTELLTGLEGRLWIDLLTHTIVRAEAHVVRPVNFGWGILVRLHPGGSVSLEQTHVGGDRWVYSSLEDHLRMREVMLHNTEQNIRMSAWNFRLLAAPMAFDEAVRNLLALSVPLKP